MRRFALFCVLAGTLSACFLPPPPRHARGRHHRPARDPDVQADHQPGYDPDVDPEQQQPPPGHDPDVHPEHQQPPTGRDPDVEPADPDVRAEAPAAEPAGPPPLSIRVSASDVRRGQEVTLSFEPHPGHDIQVFYNEKPLPKKVAPDGSSVVVTVPGDADNGRFSVEWNGHTYDSGPIRVTP